MLIITAGGCRGQTTGEGGRGKDRLDGGLVEDRVTERHHAHHRRAEQQVGQGPRDVRPEGAGQALHLRETEPGDDCGELLTVYSVHGEEGVQSVRRDTVGQVEVLK